MHLLVFLFRAGILDILFQLVRIRFLRIIERERQENLLFVFRGIVGYVLTWNPVGKRHVPVKRAHERIHLLR